MRRLIREDRGASALILAFSMILIMGIAAVALDGGRGFNERRQAQGAVDFASLAALQAAVSCELGGCTLGESADNGAAEAIVVVASNLPGRTLDWSKTAAGCSDPNKPARFTVVPSTTFCVSFTPNLDEARVHLPDNELDTTFGAVIGMTQMTVGSEAEAGEALASSSRILPNTPLGSSGAEACLFANQAPQAESPCPGVSGFYGYLDVALYGEDDLGTPSTCTNGNTNLRIAINVAKGGDHGFVTYDPGPPPDPTVNDHDACPNVNEDINEMRVETGSPTGGITDGLINGVSGSINGQPFTASPGRLVCDLATYSTDCTSVRGDNLDHTGLWEFLASGCPGTTDTHAEMLTCLNSGAPRFNSAIADHPRFAAVPVFWTTPTGPGDFTIKEFRAVWIETVYFDCTANTCDTVHSPGEIYTPPGPPPGNPGPCTTPLAGTRNCGWSDTSGPDDVEGMLAFEIDLAMLPADIADTFPSVKVERTYALTK
jgi:hypothetical protein